MEIQTLILKLRPVSYGVDSYLCWATYRIGYRIDSEMRGLMLEDLDADTGRAEMLE